MHRITLSVALALLLVLAACGDDGGSDLAIDDVDDEATASGDEGDEAGAEDDAGEDPDESEQSEESEDPAEADEGDGPDEEGPEPDPARVEDPCAEREGQEFDAFLDVVSPVDGQHVSEAVELVGCANVPEGTVRYRVLADDGETLVDDFTTAECGGPCVGEYETTVDLAGLATDHGSVTLEVFWDSPAGDGGEEDLSDVELVLE